MARTHTRTAIALQGGGALGAYALGALKYVYEAEPVFRPSCDRSQKGGPETGLRMIHAKMGNLQNSSGQAEACPPSPKVRSGRQGAFMNAVQCRSCAQPTKNRASQGSFLPPM
jgi:hypothetical protein